VEQLQGSKTVSLLDDKPPKSIASASSLHRSKDGVETTECAKSRRMLMPRRNKGLILLHVFFSPQTKPKRAKDTKRMQTELPLNKMLFPFFCKASRGL